MELFEKSLNKEIKKNFKKKKNFSLFRIKNFVFTNLRMSYLL